MKSKKSKHSVPRKADPSSGIPFTSRLWRAVVCPKFTLGLMISWSGLALLSRLLPQDGAPGISPEKLFPPEMLFFLRKAGLTDIVHSSWFIGGCLLLFLNLALLLADLLGKGTEAVSIDQTKFALQAEIPTHIGLSSRDRAAFQDAVQRWAKPVFGGARVVKDGGESTELQLAAEKGGPSRIGFCLVLIGILVAMLGSAINVLYGFKGELLLQEEQSASRIRVTAAQSTGWPLWVRDLGGVIESFDPGYEVRSQQRRLIFTRQGKPLSSEELRDGKGIRFEGITWRLISDFAPSGKELQLIVETTDRKSGKIRKLEPLLQGESRELEGATVKWTGFSDAGDLGPSAEFEYQEAGATAEKIQLFERHAKYDSVHRKKSRYVFSMEVVRPAEQATLEATWSPGADWVWGGVVLFGIGLLLWLVFDSRSYWVSLNAQRVFLVAQSSRPFLARKEFENLNAQLRSELANLEAKMEPEPPAAAE